MSSNRAWKATLRNGMKVEIDYTHDIDDLTIYVGVGDDWDECPTIQDRSVDHIYGDRLTVNRIWVAQLQKGDEILINYWLEHDNVMIAYRGDSWASWGPPVNADDITITDGDK